MNQITWRRFLSVSRTGFVKAQCESFLPTSFDALKRLVLMPREGRRPISYDQANLEFSRDYFDLCDQRDSTREQCDRFRCNFVGWLEARGLYLELEHNEYEAAGGVQ